MPPQGEVDVTVELDAHICSSESVVSTEVDSDSESSISLWPSSLQASAFTLH